MSTLRSIRTEPYEPWLLPLHKRALGTACGLAAGVVVFLATAIAVLRDPNGGLGLLGQFFAGYTVSWAGAFIGAAWAAFTGFVLGWFLAFTHNLLLAVMLVVVRTRAELAENRSILDDL